MLRQSFCQPLRTLCWLLGLSAALEVPHAAADTFPASIAVEANAKLGQLKPIWRFFGADEPNYAYMPHGRKLMRHLGELRPHDVFFRAHNLLCTGDGTPALKWGSTNAYTEDAQGTPLDFVAFHAKGRPDTVDGHVRMGISAHLRTIDDGFRIVATYPELRGTPIVIGESDPEGCAACQGPHLAYRNGTMYSSYTAASFARKRDLAEKHGVNLDDHSNAFSAWQRMGSPQNPTPQQVAQLEESCRLALLHAPKEVPIGAGKLQLTFDLPRAGVSLITLQQPTHESSE